MRTYDSVVIGAGPAGLSAAAALAARGSCLLVEQGPEAGARGRDDSRDVLSGVGGAGLFSDGKHSFFPSASALWALPDRTSLERAWEETIGVLARAGVTAGAFPRGVAERIEPGAWRAKRYPSIYVPFAKRRALIDELWQSAPERRSGVRVTGARRAGGSIEIDLGGETVTARALLAAGGRWSPRSMRAWLVELGVKFEFARVEFGVRIETRASSDLFRDLPGVDGKMLFVEPDAKREIRTFCTCRDGEVIQGEAEGLRAFSGRADCPPTGRSNVGLVVRISDPHAGAEIASFLERAEPRSMELAQWRDRGAGALAPVFGERGAAEIWRALQLFLERNRALASESARVHAPVIEGIGEYPATDGSLAAAPGVWIAGDACGRFRGIVAAMISGRYAANAIMQASRG